MKRSFIKLISIFRLIRSLAIGNELYEAAENNVSPVCIGSSRICFSSVAVRFLSAYPIRWKYIFSMNGKIRLSNRLRLAFRTLELIYLNFMVLKLRSLWELLMILDFSFETIRFLWKNVLLNYGVIKLMIRYCKYNFTTELLVAINLVSSSHFK